MSKLYKLLAIGIFAMFGFTASANAQQHFEVNNNFPYIVYFQIQSPDGTVVWPNGENYILNRTYHTFSIRCREGQRICWGAAVDGNNSTYWGQGIGSRTLGCSNCCYTCRNGTVIRLNLNP